MIGALADWFAVTALFRHPLGHPDPAHRDHPRAQGPTRVSRSATSSSPTSCRRRSSAIDCRTSASASGSAIGSPFPPTPSGPPGPSPTSSGCRRGCRRHSGARGHRAHRREPYSSPPRPPRCSARRSILAIEGGYYATLLERDSHRPAGLHRRQPHPRFARASPAGVTMVGTRGHRQTHLRQDVRRSAAVPRRRA